MLQPESTTIRTCSFPSGLQRPRGSTTMPSADFWSHATDHSVRPAFRASPTHGYASRSPQIRVVICPRSSSTSTSAHSSGSVSQSAACSPGDVGLYVVSVRNLAGLGVNVTGGVGSGRFLRTHSQASSPRSVTSPQLPSPRTVFQWKFIWYTDSLKETGTKYQGTFTPQDHAHAGRTATERRWPVFPSACTSFAAAR